jgi:plasmid stabilization system protein ParE
VSGGSPADRLRAAAQRIDQLAAKATPGPWSKYRSNSPAVSALAVDESDRRYLDGRDELVCVARVQTWEGLGKFVRERSGADLAWITAFNPAVAPALLAVLRSALDALARYPNVLDGDSETVRRVFRSEASAPAYRHMLAQMEAALALADLVLGPNPHTGDPNA